MTTIDVRLNNSAFYDVTRFDVVKGQDFTMTLNGHSGESDWFSNNDPVLSIVQSGGEAAVKAVELGSTRILIIAPGDKIVKEINIRVVEEIVPMAVSLGLKKEETLPK